jgi:glycosyltransferase involved in cell wall biosynthesis
LLAPRVRRFIEDLKPDLVHAMRVPFEGMLATAAVPDGLPLLLSIWGNDFTLHAAANPLAARATRRAMQRADALHADCKRDIRLAAQYGYDGRKPWLVLPGAGGVRRSAYHEGPPCEELLERLDIPRTARIVINPRGFRSYVCSGAFFEALPIVLRECPDTIFIAIGMAGSPTAERLIRTLGIGSSVRLVPAVSAELMADYYRLASVSVSPTIHDGTPNSLLEAMACGCLPVAGNLESIREWIEDGVNGLLCNPRRSPDIARQVVRALTDNELRARARRHNASLIDHRAEYGTVMTEVERYYARVLGTETAA